MNMLRNFTIRFVMLTILGIFCLMWAGVGLYSTWSLSRVSEGNEVDRHLVKQMTVLSQGNDQYFRFVTRLSRAMEVKAAGGTPDLSSAQQALDNMGKKLAEMKAISPGPMDPQVSSRVIGAWQALLEQGVTPQMQQAKLGALDGYRQQANNVTPTLSRAFGAAAEEFNNAAAKSLDSTRVVVDGLTSMTRTVIIVATIIGLLILLFTDRYLVAMLVAIALLRASGVMGWAIAVVKSGVVAMGWDARWVEGLPVGIMKSLSGSGARALMIDTLKTQGADSFVGRLVSIIQGSSETTFYVLAVYFGAVRITKIRSALPCAKSKP